MTNGLLLKNSIKEDAKKLAYNLLYFNLLIINYTHSSWLDYFNIHQNIIKQINNSQRITHKLSEYILNKISLKNEYFFNFENDYQKIALLAGPDLEHISILAGIAIHADKIAKIIKKTEVNELISQIGKENYLFAVKRAPFLIAGSAPNIFLEQEGENLPAIIKATAKRCFSYCFCGEERALTERLKLKIPRQVQIDFNENISPELKRFSTQLLKKITRKEIKQCFF